MRPGVSIANLYRPYREPNASGRRIRSLIGRCAGQLIDRQVHGLATKVQVQSQQHARRYRQNFVLKDERATIKRDSNRPAEAKPKQTTDRTQLRLV